MPRGHRAPHNRGPAASQTGRLTRPHPSNFYHRIPDREYKEWSQFYQMHQTR
ncbi:hypothetical protein PHLGIDRAFT_19520 [Phlebiopsis gigantea 11061_1 CR5-6]|uniref:Uncharacterized protein n=1 Tax=Phlebiopsis gigantea (strain 11061_1 CR5-6) TaxID=745531 RepID=A0A0C3S6F0_PHLG1|nr:hypothetical protein PHLGIDRAFT_19520 [Phlebiopsis gigantea 11061_1 CR5-6]